MNDQLRQYRLLEIEPVKRAMMKAHERATEWSPPLKVHTKFGMEAWRDLEKAIDAMSPLRAQDAKLNALCGDFLKACAQATDAWMTTVNELYAKAQTHPLYGETDVTRDQIAAAYKAGSGDKLVQTIRELYVELSNHMETLLK